ncbi:MAG: DUF2334 domain-containing protein [Meiothermus sp.]|nr:DUF2334 domain-containing protein [Meiothermus sp.]
MRRGSVRGVLVLGLLGLVGCASPPGGSSGTLLGLEGQYFSGQQFGGPATVQRHRQVRFEWGSAEPAIGMRPGAFSARWQGQVRPQHSEPYRFFLNATGQAQLWLDGRPVAEGQEVRLEAGRAYDLRLEFVKTGPEAALHLEWSSPSQERQTIPRSHLTPTPSASLEAMAVPTGQNLLLNPGFESGTGNWVRYGGSFSAVTPGRGGTGQAASASSFAWVQQDLPDNFVQAGLNYTLEGWGRSVGGRVCTVGVQGGSGSTASFSQTLSFTGDWERKAVGVTPPAGTAWIVVFLSSNTSECRFDDLSLTAGGTPPPPPPPPSSNLLINPGFEGGVGGAWESFGGTPTSVAGRTGGQALQGNNYIWVQQDLDFSSLLIGTNYVLRGWAKTTAGGTCTIGFTGGNGNSVLFSRTLSFQGTTWEERNLTQALTAGTTWAAVYLATAAQDCQFDDLNLSPETAPPPPTPPANPTGFASSNLTPTGVTLSWSASSGATGYTLERRTGAGAYVGIGGNITATTYTDSGLTASTAYTYRLRAANGAGSSSGVELSVTTPAPSVSGVVRVLYSVPTAAANRVFPDERVGTQAYNDTDAARLYATMLANLLGRFNFQVILQPITSYQAGQAGNTVRTFYLGSVFDEPIPAAFRTDILNGAPVTWIGYNYWQFSSTQQNSLGLVYRQVRSTSSAAQYDSTNGFNTVSYKGYNYRKQRAPLELIEVAVASGVTDAVTHATIRNTPGTVLPYVVQRRNFWFVADNPLTYIYRGDRYLVFADLIAEMVGRPQSCQPRALLRLEDITAEYDVAAFRAVLDLLERLQVPFAVTAVPLYTDNRTTPVTQIRWQDRPAMLEQLRRVERIGGRIIQHGYTHQYENLRLPLGVSVIDWEFWNVNTSGPIAGLTAQGAVNRINAGNQILRDLGLTPVGWTTPHYEMEPDFYPLVNPLFPRFFEGRLYRAGTMTTGQFFPYALRDVSGALIVPETLEYIDATKRPNDIIELARANRPLRCPWASFFTHPSITAPGYTGADGYPLSELERIIREIRNLGYTFVDMTTVNP